MKNLDPWKEIYGDIDICKKFKQKGLQYLNEHKESFEKYEEMLYLMQHKMVPYYLEAQFPWGKYRTAFHAYMLATSFFIDEDPEVALLHLDFQTSLVHDLCVEPHLVKGLIFVYKAYCLRFINLSDKNIKRFYRKAKRFFLGWDELQNMAKDEVRGEGELVQWVRWHLKNRNIPERTFVTMVDILMDAEDLARKSGHDI